MSMIVYHGGTTFNHEFKRQFAAMNGGSVGYYVTTDKKQAEDYGPVHVYSFQPHSDMAKSRLTPEQSAQLNRITRYWESYGESPDNQEAMDALQAEENVYTAMMECINSTGEITKIIKYLISLGYNYTSQPDKNVYIVIDGLTLMSSATCSSN